jgi:LysM repeat protein
LRPRPAALALALALALCLPAAARADVIHVMARGETLAGIAERYYGNVAMESVLVAANYLYLQATPTIPPGTHLVVPSVTYHRVQLNDTWEGIARRHLGDNRRGPYLARINGASFDLPPSAGTVIRLPYLLRYVVNSDEPMFEIARRFYGDRGQVLFITQYNFLATQRLQRGQAVVLPLADVVLREQPAGSVEAALVEVHNLQRRVERDLPAFRQYLARGLYAEAVALGARMLANVEVTRDQRLTIDRGLAEAYAALDRRDLAAEALRDAIATDPGLTLDPDTTPPKILDAYALARGTAPTTVIAPAPPTARPDGAH